MFVRSEFAVLFREFKSVLITVGGRRDRNRTDMERGVTWRVVIAECNCVVFFIFLPY